MKHAWVCRLAPLLVGALALGGCTLNTVVFHRDTLLIDGPAARPEAVWHESADGQKLYSLWLRPDSAARATVFLLQGQGGNVTTMATLAAPLRRHGFQVFLLGYRGYGRSAGRPAFRYLVADAAKALQELCARPEVENTKIIVLGFSLGGNLALKLAAERPDLVDAVAVEGTFTSLNREAVAVLPFYFKPVAFFLLHGGYNARQLVRGLADPLLVIHSREDRVVPFRMGKALYRAARPPKSLWVIDGGHCRGVLEHEAEYVARLRALVE